jgi:lysophospholipase L1-like esterase
MYQAIAQPIYKPIYEAIQSVLGSFNPRSLFTAGSAGAWYDPSDFSTLFQDTAGTIPVTAAGQVVGKMLDKSGNGLDLVAPSNPLRPTLQVVNGGYALVGAAAEYMTRSVGGNYANFTLIGAVSAATESGINGWFFDRFSGGFSTYRNGVLTAAQFWNGSSYLEVSTSGLALQGNVPYVQTVGYDGTTAYNGKNGGTPQTRVQAYTPDSLDALNIMGAASVGYWNGAFFGCIYINRTLTAQEKLNTQEYYYRKANIRPIIAVGDSFTYNNSYGQTIADFYPDRLDVLLGTTAYQVQNLGVSGNTSANMVARITAVDHKRTMGNGVAIVYGGTNDTNVTFSVQAAPAPTSTVFAVEAGRGSRFGAGAYITVNGEQALILSVATDTITLASALSFTPTAGQTVLIDTQANIVKLVQTIGCPRTLVLGQHFLNFATGGENTTASTGTLETLRNKQRTAASLTGAVYVDLYDWMRDLIVLGTYTLGNDTAWHVAVGDTHLNNTGEQIVADAIYAAMTARGWM